MSIQVAILRIFSFGPAGREKKNRHRSHQEQEPERTLSPKTPEGKQEQVMLSSDGEKRKTKEKRPIVYDVVESLSEDDRERFRR